jgi:hypothetical protein
MNSFPVISHHLFVAAIGDEAGFLEMPRRQKQSFVELADQAAAIALELEDDTRPMTRGGARALRIPWDQAEA